MNLKKVFSHSLLLFLLIGTAATAQTIKPISNYKDFDFTSTESVYFKAQRDELSKFTGTWQFSDATRSFKVKLYIREKVVMKDGLSSTIDNKYIDEIHSFMEYKVLVNGSWVMRYNTFPPAGVQPLGEIDYRTIRGSIRYNPNVLSMAYDEPSPSCKRAKNAYLNIEYVHSGATTQLVWKRKWVPDTGFMSEVPCPDGQMMDTSEFIIPANMVLTRVN